MLIHRMRDGSMVFVAQGTRLERLMFAIGCEGGKVPELFGLMLSGMVLFGPRWWKRWMAKKRAFAMVYPEQDWRI